MKILFLHISDAHFKQDTSLKEINSQAIVRSLNQIREFDECILIFSGDVANSGSINEYKIASKLLGEIIQGIQKIYFRDRKKINTLIVPGNHDNFIKNTDRKRDQIIQWYKDRQIDEYYYDELSQLDNYFEFSINKNKCFISNKIIDIRCIEFNSFKIKVNLINSAPFSLLGSDNGDKGLHYIPSHELDKLNSDCKQNYTISVMHHSPEWFSNNVKEKLYDNIYKSTDLFFIGHEHFSLNENKIVNGREISISSGVALYGTNTEHGFNAIILDTAEESLRGYKYIYNGIIYKPSSEPILLENDIIFTGKYRFTHTKNYKEALQSDIEQHEGDKYLKYFVFPSLEYKGVNGKIDSSNIATEEKFIEVFENNTKIIIEGGVKSGKTILSKYLCLMLSKEYVPLLLTFEDFMAKNGKNILKNALEEQYGKDSDYDEFIQLEKDKRVLIVDRSDILDKNKWNLFYNEFENIFEHIILLNGLDWNINIKEKTLEELKDKETVNLKICPFYYSKRAELINKICSLNQGKQLNDLEETTRKINEEITNQIKYFQLTPDFIHQYVDYYLNFSFLKTQYDNNVFSKVFEANITFRIAQNTKEENVDEILVALDFVAYHMHSNKRYPLPTKEFFESVDEYNKKYDNNINSMMVYNIAEKANLIKQRPDNTGIEFSDKNLLAYFVALHLNREFNEGGCERELKYILDNICFEINGDIILFLSYITSNIQILYPIIESMKCLMDEWEELDIDKGNIKFITRATTPYIKQAIPTSKDKKQNIQDKIEVEKSIVEKDNRGGESLYSYDESKVNSFSNKISKALRYLELVSKILPNFRHILYGDNKKKVVEILYIYPNKLLYFMLKDIENNIDKLITEILRDNPKTSRGMIITKSMIEKSIQTQAAMYILSIYDFIACTAASGKGIEELNKFQFEKNTNYMLQNIIIEENNGSFQSFSRKVEKLYDKTDINILKNMIGLVVRKYFLNHEVRLIGNAQHLVNKFFGEEEAKKVQLIQAKNRFIKK